MYRQGDVILIPAKKAGGRKLPHLILAEGEVTGHKHEVRKGNAELFEQDGVLYLRVNSKVAELTHEEHKTISLPKGDYEVQIQREYAVGEERYRRVMD